MNITEMVKDSKVEPVVPESDDTLVFCEDCEHLKDISTSKPYKEQEQYRPKKTSKHQSYKKDKTRHDVYYFANQDKPVKLYCDFKIDEQSAEPEINPIHKIIKKTICVYDPFEKNRNNDCKDFKKRGE